MIGVMPMPKDFAYRDVLLRGEPRHHPCDDFRKKHPSMAPGKRAKIFSPFAALKGFEDGIEAKRVEYEPRRELTEGEIEELDRRLNILWQLTRNSVLARKNRITVSVRVFIPCSDRNSDAYGSLGQYHTVTGRVTQVNNCFLRLDERKIFLKDILSIESGERMDGRALFEAFWEDGA